jgi:Tol biopolymer transport system component
VGQECWKAAGGKVPSRRTSPARPRLVATTAVVAIGVFGALIPPGSLMAAPRGISRVSVASGGFEADQGSDVTSISADGRFAAFVSTATNLVVGDTNDAPDVFVHDLSTLKTMRVSVASDASEANGGSGTHHIAISGDGQVVAFTSEASNLVPDDTNGYSDVFAHHLATGQTTRVSVTSEGLESPYGGQFPSISDNGRFVAFEASDGLVPGDDKNSQDIYVHDLETGVTEWVSSGLEARENADSDEAVISGNGRYVSFRSGLNLPPSDIDGETDLFVYDRETGVTEGVTPSRPGDEERTYVGDPHDISADGRFVAFVSTDGGGHGEVLVYDRLSGSLERVSVPSDGGDANSESYTPTISADGRHVGFQSSATNLIAGEETPGASVFVHDRLRGTTSWVAEGHGEPDISANGQLLAFSSASSTLVSGDTNDAVDVFVFDLRMLDHTPPLIEFLGNHGSYTVDEMIEIQCTATDAESGLVSTSCADIVGPAYRFEVGLNEFSASAVDVAGNVGWGNTSFAVEVTAESLGGVVEVLVADKGLATSLLSKLERDAVRAFINEVEAHRGRRISGADADTLVDLASSLM